MAAEVQGKAVFSLTCAIASRALTRFSSSMLSSSFFRFCSSVSFRLFSKLFLNTRNSVASSCFSSSSACTCLSSSAIFPASFFCLRRGEKGEIEGRRGDEERGKTRVERSWWSNRWSRRQDTPHLQLDHFVLCGDHLALQLELLGLHQLSSLPPPPNQHTNELMQNPGW